MPYLCGMMMLQRDMLFRKVKEVDASKFDALALQIFDYQAYQNPVYRQYLSYLNIHPAEVKEIESIPFLPISFFKTHPIVTAENPQEDDATYTLFGSSGTTGSKPSIHYVRDVPFYLENTVRAFQGFYGPIEDYCILGLLPSYLERSGSSLIAMVQHFMEKSRYQNSGFFLHELDDLANQLQYNATNNIPTLLIGVSFALLDFAEAFPMDLSKVIIMETGGMKGRRKEITRDQLHTTLNQAFQTSAIHSEYGMTELLSQGYSRGNGIFHPAPTLKALTREITDPFSVQQTGRTGVINLVDLANLDSCAFIATDDLGKVYRDGSFEIMGRLDHSDIRGCNLMVG